jgi:hypothetical protein
MLAGFLPSVTKDARKKMNGARTMTLFNRFAFNRFAFNRLAFNRLAFNCSQSKFIIALFRPAHARIMLPECS